MPRVNRKRRVRPKDHITRPQILELLLGPNGEEVSAFQEAAELLGVSVEKAFADAWGEIEKKISPSFAAQWYAASCEHKSFTAIAEEYARDVLAEKIPACKWVKLACERHLKDLERARSGDWKFCFDRAKADRVCRFVELWPHVKGVWAAKAQRIKLEPWQIFGICCIFGWVKVATRTRRFTLAYLEVARKNAKSILAAVIGLYMFACDGEYGAEVYSGATNEDQAHEVFRPALHMTQARSSVELVFTLGIIPAAKGLKTAEDKSRFEPVVGKPGDGASPHCGIVDEYHEHDSDTLFDTFRTGMGARQQPLQLVITTAGDNLAGPCKLLHDDLCKVLDGVERDEVFAIIYTVDHEDEWATELGLRKSNPNYGVSVFPEYLHAEQQSALTTPRKRGVFQTKNTCIWVGSTHGYFDVRKWNELGDPALSIEPFIGSPCCVSIDLASRRDFTARALIFRKVINGKNHYYLFIKLYLPQEQIKKPESAHYQEWEAKGDITQHAGAVVDYDLVLEDSLELMARCKPKEFAYDPWNADYFAQRIQKSDKVRVEVMDIRQNTQKLSLPTKELDALIAEGRIHHEGNACMAWMIGNVFGKEDVNENVLPQKQAGRSENKIDGPAATIMALSRLIVAPPKESVYKRRGILTLPPIGGSLMAARM